MQTKRIVEEVKWCAEPDCGIALVNSYDDPSGLCLKHRTQKPAAALPTVPDGLYALGEEPDVRFYAVEAGKGRWEGYTFTTELYGAPGHWREFPMRGKVNPARDRVMRAIGQDIAAAARLFGIKHRRCGFCMSPLSKITSRAAGYGPDCADNRGLWYPNEEEAKAIILARGEDLEI